jgi:branched-chain amino acid transport system substrate-binding protein
MCRPIRNAILMYTEEINQKGGIEVGGKHYKLDLDVCDDFTNPPITVACVTKYADRGIKFVIGPMGSAMTLAAEPITEERRLLCVTSAMDPKILDPPKKLVIRNNFTSEQAALLLTPYVKDKLGVKRVAILTRNEPWGIGNTEEFIKAFKKNGLEVVDNEVYEVGAKDFLTPLTKIKAKNPQGILLSAYPEEGGLILKQMAELGMNIPTFCQGTPSGGKAFFEIGKQNVKRHVSLLPPDPNYEKPAAATYLKNYIKKYGEEPVTLQAAIWYDSESAILEAFRMAKSVDDVWKVREAFNTMDFQGVCWRVRFWPNGQLIPQCSVVKFDETGKKEVVAIVGMERDGKIYMQNVKR